MIIMRNEQKRTYDVVSSEIKEIVIGSVRAFVSYNCLNVDLTVKSDILPICFYISDIEDFSVISDIIDKYYDLPAVSFSVCREEYLADKERGVFIDVK